jgi:hypothetical protein
MLSDRLISRPERLVMRLAMSCSLSAIVLLAAATASAGTTTWVDNMRLTEVAWDGSASRATFKVASGTYTNPANCPSATYYEIPQQYDPQTALSILLMARVGDRSVRFQVHGTECGAFGAPVVHHVSVR